jgi:hypothetical protein
VSTSSTLGSLPDTTVSMDDVVERPFVWVDGERPTHVLLASAIVSAHSAVGLFPADALELRHTLDRLPARMLGLRAGSATSPLGHSDSTLAAASDGGSARPRKCTPRPSATRSATTSPPRGSRSNERDTTAPAAAGAALRA